MNHNFIYIAFLFLFCILLSQNSVFAETISLLPTDDAFVAIDLLDPQDEKKIQTLNTGNLNYTKIWYANNITDIVQPFTIAFLKFDLKNYDSDQILSAQLKSHVLSSDIIDETRPVGVYLVDNNDWNESTITYKTAPLWKIKVAETLISTSGTYIWGLTSTVKQFAGKELSLVLFFSNMQQTGEEKILFSSKESIENKPVLQIDIKSNLESLPETDTVKSENENLIENNTSPESLDVKTIIPTDDTFIGLDLSTNDESFDLRNQNFGNSDFLKIWYANNVTSAQEFILTSGLLKFDLSELNLDDVASANLKMKTKNIDSHGTDKIISIQKLNNTDWSESEITYNTSPRFGIEAITVSSEITEPDIWYMWNVTSMVKENTVPKLSLGISYEKTPKNIEKNVAFYSKESDFPPYLEITLKQQGGGCLIATATYGTELSPQVQQLRELRDNILLQTESGTSFMGAFNDFYYSFSPGISDYERENPAFKEIVKIGITPMISSLTIMEYAESESQVIVYGIGVILLNLGMYLGMPTVVIYKIKKLI